MSNLGKCPICNGYQERGETIFSIDLGFGVVVVRHVPSIVCSICGEEFFEDQTTDLLERIVDTARKKHCTAEITNWKYEKLILGAV